MTMAGSKRHRFFGGLAALAILAAGCGGGGEGGRHPDYSHLSEAAAPLAALYSPGNRLLPGGSSAYAKRIAGLRGHPVVVNFWASWCGPCRLEFPTLQKLSARYGKRVAFLGVNSEDGDSNADEFLAEDPVPYPSYTDPDSEIKQDVVDSRGFPDTAYYGPDGRLCFVKLGQYATEGDMEADIRRYALANAECESG
jgi:cytochrome c biogenesis protein CcmG/thiol:disulfide interchange protein DsbE